MINPTLKRLKVCLNVLITAAVVLAATSFSSTPAMAFAGTLENGNLAFAQSEFNKGEACNYLPGFESGYDAWHFVLTTRGATFQQSPTNPAIAINLNFVFMRLDGSLFTIKSGAWVQTGKGAYTYTPVQDRIRMVQAGSVAQINGSDSGMRLSHTCPGTGVAVTTSPSPTPTATTASPSPSPTATRSPSPSPTPTATATRSASPSPTPTATATRSASPSPTSTATATRSASPSPSPTSTRRPSPSPTPTATVASPTASPTPTPSPTPTLSPTISPTPTPVPSGTPTLRSRPTPTPSAIQSFRPGARNVLPTPTPTPQPLIPTPTPSPTATSSPSPSPSATATPSPSATSSPGPEPSLAPPVVPTPPPIEDPKTVEYVEPNSPKNVDPQKFPDPPSSPVVITQEPKFGNITENPNGTFTYVPTPQSKPVVDVVEFQYTNLAGATVVVRKEFVVIQKGDVPSIIQTGSTSPNRYTGLLILMGLATISSIRLMRSKFHG